MVKITTWRDYAVALSLTILFSLFVRNFVLTVYQIPTTSMQPNLLPGDFIFALRNSIFWKFETQRGDLIVFSHTIKNENALMIRRVVGLPGDKIEMVNGNLVLNGQSFLYQKDENLEPPKDGWTYLRESIPDHEWRIAKKEELPQGDEHFGPMIVPENAVFVLADQRGISVDSRTFGFVELSQITGKAIFVGLSWYSDAFGVKHLRSSRIFSRL